jgi:hypothetical protein
MCNQIISVNGYDRNYVHEQERSKWLTFFDLLSDKILQPTSEPLEKGVVALPFYGYQPTSPARGRTCVPKMFDILHVGHNWWRWQDISDLLLPAIEKIREDVGDIGFVGSWWNGVPPACIDRDLEVAFHCSTKRFQELRIQVKPAVPYVEVIQTMSTARVNIMTQRQLFRRLKILTSKYFEIFSADTIPLVMIDPDHAEFVYGPYGRELALFDRMADKLKDALRQPLKYQEIVERVRHHLSTHQSYHNRVKELVIALQS